VAGTQASRVPPADDPAPVAVHGVRACACCAGSRPCRARQRARPRAAGGSGAGTRVRACASAAGGWRCPRRCSASPTAAPQSRALRRAPRARPLGARPSSAPPSPPHHVRRLQTAPRGPQQGGRRSPGPAQSLAPGAALRHRLLSARRCAGGSSATRQTHCGSPSPTPRRRPGAPAHVPALMQELLSSNSEAGFGGPGCVLSCAKHMAEQHAGPRWRAACVSR